MLKCTCLFTLQNILVQVHECHLSLKGVFSYANINNKGIFFFLLLSRKAVTMSGEFYHNDFFLEKLSVKCFCSHFRFFSQSVPISDMLDDIIQIITETFCFQFHFPNEDLCLHNHNDYRNYSNTLKQLKTNCWTIIHVLFIRIEPF